MQESLEQDTTHNPTSIGELDTTSIAKELPAILRVDGSEYHIYAESTPEVSETSADTIEVEVPCLYCDTKNKMQYSGSVPALVSCMCSHCDEKIEISSHWESSSISVPELADQIRKYQNKRVAYIAGQQSTKDLDNVVRNGKIIARLCSFVGIGLIYYGLFSLNSVIAEVHPAVGTLLLGCSVILGLSLFVFLLFSEHTIMPKLLSWYINIPGDNDYNTVMKFFEGYED